MNRTLDHVDLSRTRQETLDILFKGLRRKVSHTSYSKIKHSYKKKPIQPIQSTTPLSLNLFNRSKLKLSIIPNRVTDPQQAHDQLLKIKEANHQLFQENTLLLRKIRKEQKIQEIYTKKLQGNQLYQLDFFRALEIKLLLEVEILENSLEEKQSLYQQKISYLKAQKQFFPHSIFQRRMEMYQLMADTPEDLTKLLKTKKSELKDKENTFQKVHDKISKVKQDKNNKLQNLNKIKQEIKELKDIFKSIEAQSKRDKASSVMVNITSLMSSLMTNSQKPQTSKQASSKILKNNVSSISVKNRSNIEQIQKEIAKIKQEYERYNNEIQQFMDEIIKKKIIVYNQIHEIQEKQREEREMKNKNSWNRKEGPIVLTKQQRSKNPLKNPIVMGINA